MSEQELNKAFYVLEMYGVPKSRAKTVANGINVLITRMRKENYCLEAEIKRLQTIHNKDYAKCPGGSKCKNWLKKCSGCIRNENITIGDNFA